MKKPVNAFQWREFMAEEKAKEPKKKATATTENMLKATERRHKENPTFGTIPWLSKRNHMLKPKDFLVYSRAGAPK